MAEPLRRVERIFDYVLCLVEKILSLTCILLDQILPIFGYSQPRLRKFKLAVVEILKN